MGHRILVDERWLNSMQTLLNSVEDRYIQSYSISIVPKGLKQSNKEDDDAHIPRVVSMGPRFKGTKEDLLLMEEVKLRCMLSLIFRAGRKNQGGMHLRRCYQEILRIEEEIRASYVVDISHINVEDLVKILIVDGCFLLELLISKNETLNNQIPSRARPLNPAAQVLENEEVLSDLILFENQIPICVLHAISRALFPRVFVVDDVQRVTRINNLVLTLLGYNNELRVQILRAPHVLDVVHSYVNRSAIQRDGNHVPNIPARRANPELKRCASRLQAAGVTIRTVAQEANAGLSLFGLLRNYVGDIIIWLGNTVRNDRPVVPVPPAGEELLIQGLDFDFEFNFERGELVIAKLHIKKTTKATWLNMIAWEHHKNKREIVPDTIIGKFTSAALIFDGLICCAADVKLLKDKNVIVDHTEMSNKEVKEFFHTMLVGVDHGVVDTRYVQTVNGLNNYTEANFFIQRWRIFWHVFCILDLEWVIIFLRKNYNLVALLVTLLTIVQTVYVILLYHLPNN